jgi:hypothetical protein
MVFASRRQDKKCRLDSSQRLDLFVLSPPPGFFGENEKNEKQNKRDNNAPADNGENAKYVGSVFRIIVKAKGEHPPFDGDPGFAFHGLVQGHAHIKGKEPGAVKVTDNTPLIRQHDHDIGVDIVVLPLFDKIKP